MRKLPILFGLITLFLAACHHNELFDDEITSIDVQGNVDGGTQNRGQVIITISDQNFIEDLTHELETAKGTTIADIDMMGPDYYLIFKHDDEVVKELGYYTEDMNFNNRIGRYTDFEEGLHYGVTTVFPIKGEVD